MKKKGLPLIIALVCLLVLCAGYVCLVKYNDKQEKADSADTSTVLNLKVDDVSKIAYEIDGEMVSFTRMPINGHWIRMQHLRQMPIRSLP